MICDKCKKAGKYNTEANQRQFHDGVKVADSIREVARKWHAKCLFKDCTCQHVLGDFINRDRVNDITNAN